MSLLTSRRVVVSCLSAMLWLMPGVVSAQGLADVARSTSASRKEQPKAGKVYTNSNLKNDITPSAPAAPAAEPGSTTVEAGSVTTAEAAATSVGDARGADTAKDEAAWRARMAAAREALERSTTFVSALQSQINALTTEFINRDDPAQRGAIEQRRTKAVADLERTQREVEANRKAISAIEDEARKAGVPAGWLR